MSGASGRKRSIETIVGLHFQVRHSSPSDNTSKPLVPLRRGQRELDDGLEPRSQRRRCDRLTILSMSSLR